MIGICCGTLLGGQPCRTRGEYRETVIVTLRRVVCGLLVAVVLMLVVSGNALANGGGEAEPATSVSPLALIPAGVAVVAVGYVVFRIFRGRQPKP